MFTHLLVEFLFRLTFGVATAMAITPSRWVTSGFFRVHLWVLLGVQTLAALAAYSPRPLAGNAALRVPEQQFWLAIAAMVMSYVGAVVWMYEQRRLGKLFICGVAAAALAGCWWTTAGRDMPIKLQLGDSLTSGLLLGLVTTAMLLGHWYLNTPTMKLEPLKLLIVLLAVAVALRMTFCASGAWLEASTHFGGNGMSARTWSVFLMLRWLSGLIGVLGLSCLTWQTLKIPNTQSATGILYAAVVLAFIGELTSLLLSAQSAYPV